jgi:excisionase family DNA binding protein
MDNKGLISEMGKSILGQRGSENNPRLNDPGTVHGRDARCLTVSVEEAGRILGISRGAAYTYARDGSIPTIRLGKRLLVPKAALDKLLDVEVRDAG